MNTEGNNENLRKSVLESMQSNVKIDVDLKEGQEQLSKTNK